MNWGPTISALDPDYKAFPSSILFWSSLVYIHNRNENLTLRLCPHRIVYSPRRSPHEEPHGLYH